MARGNKQEVGATRIAQNGYHYTKVGDVGNGNPGWRLTHHIYAEKYLGRKLRADERVTFKTGNKLDFSRGNIIVMEKGTASIRRRKAQIEARMAEFQAELDEINAELAKGRVVHRDLES